MNILASLNYINTNRRLSLAVILLLLASFPIQIYAVPGFEITPSLVLAPLVFLLFERGEKAHLAVLLFICLCGLLAVFGIIGTEGKFRNLIGAASFSSGAPYILIGTVLYKSKLRLDQLWNIILPTTLIISIIFMIDFYISSDNVMKVSDYSSTSYNSEQTTFINSFFPFYGKYAVITLTTICMLIGSLTLGATSSFKNKNLRLLVLAFSSILIFISFTMWTRQVMLGIIIFYGFLVTFAYKRKETWIALLFFAMLMAPWLYFFQSQSSSPTPLNSTITTPHNQVITPELYGGFKLNRAIKNIESGNIDDLSTGRMSIYREAFKKLNARIFFSGCGFCNLKDTLAFQFSSLHNIFLTAIFKGGIFYALFYCGAAFFSLIKLWSFEKTFARDVSLAAVLSIAIQGMVNDTLFFQVIPALLFTLTGYCLSHTKQRSVSNFDSGTKMALH